MFLAGVQEHDLRPTFLELISQEQLLSGLHPAVAFLLERWAQRETCPAIADQVRSVDSGAFLRAASRAVAQQRRDVSTARPPRGRRNGDDTLALQSAGAQQPSGTGVAAVCASQARRLVPRRLRGAVRVPGVGQRAALLRHASAVATVSVVARRRPRRHLRASATVPVRADAVLQLVTAAAAHGVAKAHLGGGCAVAGNRRSDGQPLAALERCVVPRRQVRRHHRTLLLALHGVVSARCGAKAT
eukprot:ctg_1891.g636